MRFKTTAPRGGTLSAIGINRLFDIETNPPAATDLYSRLNLGQSAGARPYTIVNMVSTVDGKILQGQPGATAAGLGSAVDHSLMKRLRSQVDAVATGAGTLRVGNVTYPKELCRIVVTNSGCLPWNNRFFTDVPNSALVAVPRSLDGARLREASAYATVLQCGDTEVDPLELGAVLMRDYNVGRLLVEGGGNLNASFLMADALDELFLTVAPKLKGGTHLPTVIGGAGLPGDETRRLQLVSVYECENELYLRYRTVR